MTTENKLPHIHISIDRAAKSWAIFKDHYIVGAFEKYTDEDQAKGAAMTKCQELFPGLKPDFVYPQIRSMRTSSRR